MPLAMLQFETKKQKCIKMEITIFKIFISFGEVYRRKYIVGNHVLQLFSWEVVKLNF